MTHLNVAVRVRPMSQREISLNAVPVVEVNSNIVSITNLKVPEQYAGDSRERVRRFSFDCCFGTTSNQENVFNVVNDIIGNAVKKKYHSCVLAYGQSSSGKTHTMMGFQEQFGLTPRLCERIFDYLKQIDGDEEEKEHVTISYLEIHNEKVNDLLADNDVTSVLKIREHPVRGTYVQGLKEYKAENPERLLDWLKIGNKKRRVSATSVNPQSSRSHSVVTLKCLGGVKLTLVDLAGSERSNRVHTKSTFWEGANINKSLVALGNVISSLADQSVRTKGYKKRFIPYRDSVLTWLLKDTLGGNSQTLMIATVSPSSVCYSETVNTLRFGHRAKQIVAQPVANEDPKQKVIRDLKLEIVKLKQLLSCCQITPEDQFVLKPLSNKSDASTNTENINCPISLKKIIIDKFNGPTQKSLFGDDVTDFNNINQFINTVLKKTLQNIDGNKSFNINPKNISKAELESSLCSTDKLIPVMDVTTISDDKPVVKLRRTYSVLSEKDAKSAKRYGSYETLSTKGEKMKKPTPTALIRKRSIDKPSTSLAKVEAKVDSIRKMTLKPRSEIVAAVTQRLYSKVNKKEVATETEEVIKENKGTMARPLRLQDITQRAMRYYKRKHIETQTESDPVVRVKDTCTDVDDLKIETNQFKHISVCTEEIKLENVGTNCNLLRFDSSTSGGNGLKLTTSCGVQVDEDNKELKQPQNLLSFTKYLRGKENNKENIPNPIYTSSVNIHVSHNYINNKEKNENDLSISEDSLDDNIPQSFQTPDLISNHNSLEHDKINFANINDTIPYDTINNQNYNQRESCQATPNIIPELYQAGISISPTYASEINVTKTPERILPLKSFHPISSKPNITQTQKYEKVTINEPIILKSIMKQHYDSDSSDFSMDTFENVQDSLNYHKRVHFPKEQHKDSRVFEAMTNFLKEASALMANLSIVADKLDKPEQAHEIQVSLSDISEMVSKKIKKKYRKKKRNESPNFENISCQTSPKRTTNIFTETEEFPNNKYESIVKNSCDRLEQLCNNKASGNKSTEKIVVDESVLHRFPQPFSVSDWNDFSYQQYEDSSIESNPTYSDYGSLPRRKVKHKSFLSPSEYLRQLTSMRKQIIDTSRDELLNDHRMVFE
ncbi:uncharacterized protein [Onthophagus taurus]|uniref:uncharacterized protein isoform X1 n=1 Tax=Onthophagus taurus TaxID=166361 RepID=UPI0039BEC8C2